MQNEDYIEKALDEADRLAEDTNTKYLTHNEVFGKIKRKITEREIIEHLKKSEEDIKMGRTIPAEEVFRELREEYGE